MAIERMGSEQDFEHEKQSILSSDHIVLDMIQRGTWEASAQRHFGDTDQSFSNRTNEQIEAFLSDYLGKPVQLVSVDADSNSADGFPVWTFKVQDKE